MAGHNAIQYATNLSRGVKRLFGLDDLEEGLSRLSETLQLNADLFSRPEFAYPLGESKWSVDPSQAASAAEVATVGISNPAASGMLCIITDYHVVLSFSGGAFVAQERAGANPTPTFDAIGTPTQNDLRVPNFPNPPLVSDSFADARAAAPGSLLGETDWGTSLPFIVPVHVILPPGFFFGISHPTVNTGLKVRFRGYERRAYPGELSGQ